MLLKLCVGVADKEDWVDAVGRTADNFLNVIYRADLVFLPLRAVICVVHDECNVAPLDSPRPAREAVADVQPSATRLC